MSNTKHATLSLLEGLLAQGILSGSDLRQYTQGPEDPYHPEYLRQNLSDWYCNLGLESILGRKLSLSPCPFSREEIEAAAQNQETILCVPGQVTREQLGELFRINTWALHEPLAAPATEKEDFWFKTSLSLRPGHMNLTGVQVKQQFADEGKIHLSLERYLVFIGRVRHLTKQTPDQEYWIWLPRGAYDRSGMLIAGYDRNGSFSVHGWMPHFSASFVGARYGLLPQHPEAAEGPG